MDYSLNENMKCIDNIINKKEKTITIHCNNGKNKKYRIKEEIYQINSKYQEILVIDTYKLGRCLFLNGIIQSCQKYHDVYDTEMLRYVNGGTKEILILGGGDGNIVFKTLERNPKIKLTVVEIDKLVIDTSKKFIYKSLFDHKNVKVIISDAQKFLKNSYVEKYDQVIIDLTDKPIGLDSMKLTDFYVDFIKLSYRLLKNNSYLSVYIGCDKSIVQSVQEKLTLKIEKRGLNIPSFGETCYILHIYKIE